MATEVLSAEVTGTLTEAQQRARQHATKSVSVDGSAKTLASPFPSPPDWRDCPIYFLLLDRFNNPSGAPNFAWNEKYSFRQGGIFEGVRTQLPYLKSLGVGALWLSPILKNPKPDRDGFAYNYAGYSFQDLLNVDERFGSDGTRAAAERELIDLVDEAHARGLYVIIDIVLNHAGRIFDYVRNGTVVSDFSDASVLYGPLGSEPPIQWMNGFGQPRSDWQDNLPPPAALSADDAVWPVDLQVKEFFRRRGSKLSDSPGADGFVSGDFGADRQLVAEYDASVAGQESIRARYGPRPVLSILALAYKYLIAKFDIDGFRIDTVKYIRPDIMESFGNAMREYALTIGKANFFTFGEIYDNEDQINRFIGRNSGDTDGFGIDAALDFPTFFVLPGIAKGFVGVEQLRAVFETRKAAEQGLISSHGEAGRYFVSFVDNHDQNERVKHPSTPTQQVTMALAMLVSLQGIPCIYYGTEQALQGTVDSAGNATLDSAESVREALWGKTPVAFDLDNAMYHHLQAMLNVRAAESPLRYGRLYFRPVAANGSDFGQSSGAGGVVAFSRILADGEVVLVANTNTTQRFEGAVLVDFDLSQRARQFNIAYSNAGTAGTATARVSPGRLFDNGNVVAAPIASLPVSLGPMEAQILAPI
jgi:glycosidase